MPQLLRAALADGGGAAATPARTSQDGLAAAARPSAPEPAAKPASVSQEIFERKGWNSMDGSGFKPWG